MKCNEKILKEILLKNGFKQTEYETILGEIKFEYVPTDDVVEITINEGISFRTSNCDAKIRIENNQLIVLTSYQDYWGGFFNNEMKIDLDIIKKLHIKRTNF